MSHDPTGTPAVTVDSLTRRFGDFTAVDNISFAVRRGEIFGFLGPNGAGKSTTIRMLCGILTPSAGTGTVDGLDINTDSETIKERIGYMSQKFSLYEDLTVSENIDFYADIYGVPYEKMAARKDWILTMANLKDRARSLTRELAMGWKQRLALGCAVIHEPRILFLDEPTAGVDPVSRRNFWDLIYHVAGEGVTVFVTTHYMDEAEHCDRLAMIYRGRLVALGSPSELKRRQIAGTLYEVHTPHLMRTLEILRAKAEFHDVSVFGSSLHFRSALPEAHEAAREETRRAGVPLAGIEAILPSLEDVFVSLVEEADQEAMRNP